MWTVIYFIVVFAAMAINSWKLLAALWILSMIGIIVLVKE